jgi:F-type H+-transporting ATPase subunit b
MPHATVLAAATETAKTNNFLIPNATFFVEIVVFVVILWFLAKNVFPRIIALLEQRQATIRQQFEEARQAKEDAEKARQDYQGALAETRREISRLREEANTERQQIIEEARADAAAYREEQLRVLDERLATERTQILLSLRNEIGELAFALSEKIVRESLRDDERQRRLVEDFIAGVGTTVKVEVEAR